MAKSEEAKKTLNYFEELNNIDVSDKVEKKNGLSYLSWAYAWGELKKRHPSATYKIYEREDGINYFTDGKTAWVKTSVTLHDIPEIGDLEYIEELPVMDYKNKSVKVADIDSFIVNKTIQRSLTKAVARHGLGLYLYAGEDLPEAVVEEEKAKQIEAERKEAEALSKVITEIDTDIQQIMDISKETMNNTEVRTMVSQAIKSVYIVNGKHSANYKTIKDIKVAKAVLKEIKNLLLSIQKTISSNSSTTEKEDK